jgi:hypothetical protein
MVSNLKWDELDKDDKAVIVKAAKELPSMARIFLYGETRPTSEEETEALLAYNDELKEPLFIEAFGGTIRMLRYDNNAIRFTLPHPEYRRAWLHEEAYLGLSELDDELDFTFAALRRLREATGERMHFPCSRFTDPIPTWKETADFNNMYLGAFLLFRKTGFHLVSRVKFFARLPKGWFDNLMLRPLLTEESDMVSAAANHEAGWLTNSELKVIKTLESNSRRFLKK